MSLSYKFLSAAILLGLASTASAAGPADRALALVQANPQAFKASAYDRFTVRSATNHESGSTVRLERTYRGLPVFEGDMVMVLDRAGNPRSSNMTLRAPLNIDIRPSISSDAAIVAAGAAAGSTLDRMPTAELIISNHGTPTLAWKVRIETAETDVTYFVGAGPRNGGKVLFSTDNHETAAAAATFKTLYSGNVASTTNSITGGYELRDPSRGNGWTVSAEKGRNSGLIYTDTDNVWGNNTNSDPASAAADAQYGVGVTWDYYKNVHGRNGIANDGKGAQNRVHYGRNYVNAYWSDSCFCMTYGDGDGVTYGPLVNIDVAGHEMSHGVMSREANLTYSGESGGLNEANSDIMGTMVEFYSNNANDGGDYLIGEKIYISNPGNTKALRYMFQPSIEGNGAYSSDCWYSGVGSLDVHYSSGPANHFFYILAEGTAAQTFPGSTRVHSSKTCVSGNQKVATGTASLSGIGRDAAAKIWYTAVRDIMTAGTNYAGARAATLQAAAQLYGNGSANYNAVAAAWSAVGVN